MATKPSGLTLGGILLNSGEPCQVEHVRMCYHDKVQSYARSLYIMIVNYCIGVLSKPHNHTK
jgi:hypothetical protein